MDSPLFFRSNWHSIKDSRLAALRDEIDSIDEHRLLNTPLDDLCESFFKKYSIDVPRLAKDAITVDYNEPKVGLSRVGTIVEVDVPFSGEPSMFNVRPSTSSFNPPRAEVKKTRSALRFRISVTNLDTEQVKGDINEVISSISTYLMWQRRDVKAFDAELRATIAKRIKSRRDNLVESQKLISSLGFELRERQNTAKTFSAPAVRRRITPVMPATNTEPLEAEPALLDDQFGHIIEVIEKMSIVMERSPGAFLNMDEETLRSHILVQLNGHYEGNATGETFNYEGKTDILIRVKNKNIFVAECKFWKGPKSLASAIDQLLGYVSWRDIKTAIILFNRQKNFTNVLAAIPDVVKKHPNYKRQAKRESGSKFRYILRHRDDPNRELTLAVIAFDVPTKL